MVSDDTILVHGFDTQRDCVYDFKGQASQISIGTLLENITIAASRYQLKTKIEPLENLKKNFSVGFKVQFISDTSIQEDPLVNYIEQRSVQRRPFNTRPLTREEKLALEQTIGKHYRIEWIEGSNKNRMAWMLFKNGQLRLTLPEAFPVHQKVIEKGVKFSTNRIPDKAVGLDPITTFLMGWVMKSWGRVHFFNTFLGGTLAPCLQLDLIPGLACAAHFVLVANEKPTKVLDYINAGRALQRFWLTCTQLNLQLQPEVTPLIFSKYVAENIQFSQTPGLYEQAIKIKQKLEDLVGVHSVENAVFMGRVGSGKPAEARSLRLSLDQLIIKNN